MISDVQSEKPSWTLAAILVAVPVISFVVCAWNRSQSLNQPWTGVVWLVYLGVAIYLNSWPLECMLIGMAMGGLLPPVTHGFPAETILAEAGTAFQLGGFGFLVGCIPSMISEVWRWIVCLVSKNADHTGIEAMPNSSDGGI